ncbi:prefoldin subunit beta [Candidatus Woesearchaeota archaeon]|nr:prefoldin subunit beta [Candidatus Woesearchaeota archaeon]
MVDQEKIQQLQIIEHNLSNLSAQKQQFQNQVFEVDNALKELNSSKQTFKIVGNIMVESSKNDLEAELKERKELSELRVQTFEKQEKKLQDQAKKLQEEVLAEMKKK